MFSQRVLSIKQSPIRKFAPIRDKVTAQGINVIPLNIGQPDIKTPSVFFDAIKAIDPQNVIAYTESRGTDDILDAFSKYYKSHNADFEPEDFIITNGGSEALSYVFATLCDNEDEILVFSPYYANYNTIAVSYTHLATLTPPAPKSLHFFIKRAHSLFLISLCSFLSSTAFPFCTSLPAVATLFSVCSLEEPDAPPIPSLPVRPPITYTISPF